MAVELAIPSYRHVLAPVVEATSLAVLLIPWRQVLAPVVQVTIS